jgi:hypothetical protein
MRRVRVRWVLLVVAALAVLAVAWTGWLAWQVNQDLDEAVAAVDDLRTATEAGDSAAMDTAIERLTAASASADDRTSGLTWSVLTRLPAYGDDARGVEVVSSVVHDLAVDAARPLVDVSDGLDELLPQGGQISVDALETLRQPVATAEQSLARADEALAAEDPSGFVMRLRDQYRDLASEIRDTHHALASASTALDVLPTMLGAEGPRHYLLVFENNAEIRATGGLPGAVALLTAEDGRIELTRQAAGSSLNGQRPILPMTEAEDGLFTDIMGRYFVNANMTPDFPRTATLMKAWWESAYPDQVDGVLSIDPVALSFILGATGPVQVGDVTLSADNVVDELLHGVYLRYEDPAAQDAFFQQVARTVFDQVLAGSDDPQALVRALARGADQSRLYVHSFDETVQASLAGTAVSGEFVTDASRDPQVTVALNDSTGAKMSYFLRYDVNVQATSCGDDVQSYTASAVLESAAPADAASLPDYITGGGFFGADPGTQFVNLNIFAPTGGTVSGLRVSSTKVPPAVIDYDGRPTDTVAVELEPGQKIRVSWRMTSGPGQTGSTDVFVTPGIEDRAYSSTAASACRS